MPACPDIAANDREYRLTVQIYDAETLEKLPVTATGAGGVADDGVTAILLFEPVPAETVIE